MNMPLRSEAEICRCNHLRSALSATNILLEQVTIKEILAQLAGAIEAIMVFPDDLVF